jgi:excisionase family DNA binding protein
LTVDETAAMLKVNPETIRRYIASGRLPAVRIGRRIRIRREAIETLAEPVHPKQASHMPDRNDGAPDSSVTRLTDAQVVDALAAIRQAARFRETLLDRHGGMLLPESWPLIREAREERASRL